jgi:hypothetical protein
MCIDVFTSITANYIPKARVLAHSIKRSHPTIRFSLLLSDTLPAAFDLATEPFDSVILLQDLNIPNLRQWIFKHSLVELSTAVKGFALVRLLRNEDCSAVLYFDPDIVALTPLDELIEHFTSHSILLTPHLTEPETTMEGILDNELCVLQHGVFNLGFIGIKNSPEGRRFANWWADRLTHFCRDDIPRGLFTDQRWIDLAPAYFEQIAILRDPVYNVCTWNLNHRQVEGNLEEGLRVGGQKIVFYHFSGLDSGAQQLMLDKYGSGMPGLYELREWYLRECERMGQQQFSSICWAYGQFDNAETITAQHRKSYRDRVDLQDAFPDPFATHNVNRSYYHWFEANSESCIQKLSARVPRRSWWQRLHAHRNRR